MNIKLNVAICDKSFSFCEKVRTILQIHFHDCLNLIEDFSNSNEFFDFISEYKTIFHIVLLSIEFPVLDGLAFGKKLRFIPGYTNSQILLFSNEELPAGPVVEIQPLVCAKKTLNITKLICVIEHAIQSLTVCQNHLLLVFKNSFYKFPLRDVVYISCYGRKCLLHLRSKTSITLPINLSQLYIQFLVHHRKFTYINQSCIINADLLCSVTKTDVTMITGEKLSISRTYKSSFFEKLTNRFKSY